jgi:hypothetical protein
MNSHLWVNRSGAILNLFCYAGMFLWCLWLLYRAIILPAPEPLFIFGSGPLVGRAIEYFHGLYRKDRDLQFSFYGMEFCGAGYLIARFGGPSPLVVLLFVLGLCILVTQYFSTKPLCCKTGEGLTWNIGHGTLLAFVL